MKKIFITLTLVAALLASLTACSTPETPVETTSDTAIETTVSDETVAKTLVAAFKTEASKEGATTNSIATTLSENETLAFSPMVQDMEAGYLVGFINEVTDFEACTLFAPMIGTIPFVGYVFELAEDADVDAFVESLENNHNLRWNICTAAEEMAVESEGNFVCFVMAPMSFETEEVEEGDETEVHVENDETSDVEAENDADVTEEVVDETTEIATEEVVEETESVA